MADTTEHATGRRLRPAIIENPAGSAPVLLICEHASADIPEDLQGLGLTPEARLSHAAWDPGALGTGRALAAQLDARLVYSGVSRLVYDCNRPPEALGAMPARSEIFDIPGNAALSEANRAERVRLYYEPFRAALAEQVARPGTGALVTVHSFTPVYNGARRAVEIGVLHDADARLADAMLACAPAHTDLRVERNAPYGPGDGVMHTLRTHAGDRPNVMLEIRNDLITTPAEQRAMGAMLAGWLREALGGPELALPEART